MSRCDTMNSGIALTAKGRGGKIFKLRTIQLLPKSGHWQSVQHWHLATVRCDICTLILDSFIVTSLQLSPSLCIIPFSAQITSANRLETFRVHQQEQVSHTALSASDQTQCGPLITLHIKPSTSLNNTSNIPLPSPLSLRHWHRLSWRRYANTVDPQTSGVRTPPSDCEVDNRHTQRAQKEDEHW